MFLQSSDRLRTCWPLNRMQAMFRGCNATSWPVYKYGRKIISCIWVPRWYSILPPMTFDLCANSLQVSFAFDCPRQRTLPWSPKTAAGSWRNRLPWDDSAISQVAQEAAAVICAPKLLPDGRDCILFFLIVKKKPCKFQFIQTSSSLRLGFHGRSCRPRRTFCLCMLPLCPGMCRHCDSERRCIYQWVIIPWHFTSMHVAGYTHDDQDLLA